MARQPLRCWWDELHVADITARRPWDLRLKYTDAAHGRWATNAPALSCSLPVQRRPKVASNFLRGLLPEGRQLQAVAQLAGVAVTDTYRLLARYGRDVAGALVITAEDDPPTRDRYAVEPYTAESLAAEVEGLDEHPLGVHPDSELSLPGLQNKLLLVELDGGRWGRPVHGHPSTHILKVDDQRYPGLVTAEASCLRLAYSIGLAETPPITTSFGSLDCIIVRRYDRILVDGLVERVHQEDACQALDVDAESHQGRAKYETSGGPSLRKIAMLLSVYAHDRERELERLLRMVTFSMLIGNADAHGKNISILHDLEGYISLAPVYDTVPTMLWPRLRAKAAMSVNGKWVFGTLTIHDLVAEARLWGLSSRRAQLAAVAAIETVRSDVPKVVDNDELASRILERGVRLLSSPRIGESSGRV